MSMTQASERHITPKPLPGNTSTVMVRGYLEKALVEHNPNFSHLTAEMRPGFHRPLGQIAIEAVAHPTTQTLDRHLVWGLLQEFGSTLLEAALEKIALSTDIPREALYGALYDGQLPPSGSLQTGMQSGHVTSGIRLSVMSQDYRYADSGPRDHTVTVVPHQTAPESTKNISVNPDFL